MIFRNLIFEPEVVKQRLRAGMVSHHKQQASKCNGEQQHRVLWPAYNLNIAPPQASTEGLFQQTQAITPTITGEMAIFHQLMLGNVFNIDWADPRFASKNPSLRGVGNPQLGA